MSGIFGYSREAVRVKVKKCEGILQPEHRKFSVDPQITSFEVLQSILAKAFDIKGDFTVSYRTFDDYGQETYLSLLSDWDLDAAFLSASEPNLCLQVDMKPFEESSEDWDVVGCIDVPRTQVPETKPQTRFPGLIMNQMERTLNLMQRALNLVEEQIPISSQPPRPPLADAEFRRFLDPIGQVVQSRELRSVIYFGGIEPSLRKVVWKHLLNVYPDGMSGKERMDYMKKKAYEYQSLRDCWKDMLQNGHVVGDLAFVTSMVRKDVLRTDRHHKFYAGSDDNQNIASLFNILTTYALNHPTVSYCQGMSDLASPLLVTMGDEAHAYICFCALMRRLHSNFLMDGITMTLKFQHLAEGLLYYDPEFYAYLKSHQADDLLFCYRWLLLEMKREFAFDDALCMLEVLWSALPPQAFDKELPLYELRFCPEFEGEDVAPVSPLLKPLRENAYTKVCALRRQGSAVSLHAMAAGVPTPRPGVVRAHRQNHSLDETAGRRSATCAARGRARVKPFASLDDATIRPTAQPRSRSVSPFEMVDTADEGRRNAADGGNSDSVLKPVGRLNLVEKVNGQYSDVEDIQPTDKRQGRVVKNLNEFLSFKSSNKYSLSEENNTDDAKCEIECLVDQCKDEETTPLIKMTDSSSDESLVPKKGPRDTRNNDSSPDDSNDYFPMTTSMTRELRLELESLDRQVFGAKFNQQSIALDDEELDSPGSDSMKSSAAGQPCYVTLSRQELHLPNDVTVTEVTELNNDSKNASPSRPGKLDKSKYTNNLSRTKKAPGNLPENMATSGEALRLSRSSCRASPVANQGSGEDIFVWENPIQYPTTPDEQADLDLDADNCFDENSAGEIFENEGEGVKSVTPIRLLHSIGGSTHRRRKSSTADASDSSDSTPVYSTTHAPRRKSSREASPCAAPLCEEARERTAGNSALRNNAGAQRQTSAASAVPQLPPPSEFGAGNPFLMFLCLTVLRQHRDFVMRNGMDYNEMAMHFDKMVRKHNVSTVLNQARQMYDGYKKQQAAVGKKNSGLSV